MDYIVETQFEGPGFVAVPNAVAQLAALSADALGVLVWLASLPKGFAIRRSTILERFGFGKDKWQSVARSLSAVGALEVVKARAAGGTFTSRYVVRWPSEAAVQSTGAGKSGSGESEATGAGKSAMVGRKIRQNLAENPAPYTEQIRKTKRAAADTGRSASVSAAPRSAPSPDALAGEGPGAPVPSRPAARTERLDAGEVRALVGADLSAFQRNRVLCGQSVVVEGLGLLKEGQPLFDALRYMLRMEGRRAV